MNRNSKSDYTGKLSTDHYHTFSGKQCGTVTTKNCYMKQDWERKENRQERDKIKARKELLAHQLQNNEPINMNEIDSTQVALLKLNDLLKQKPEESVTQCFRKIWYTNQNKFSYS